MRLPSTRAAPSGVVGRALLLAAVSVHVARADSLLEIIGQLKTFRDASLELFGTTAKALKEAGAHKDAEKVQKWSDDWLSVLGLQRGLTGLTKDYVLNYLGRSSYHSANGPLIAAIKSVAAAFPKRNDDLSDESVAKLRLKVLDVCNAGLKVFEEGGSLNEMLSELKAVLQQANMPHFAEGLKKNAQVKKALEYFAGPRPDTTDTDAEEL